MILDIDAGNTRIKWRLLSPDDKSPDRGVCMSPQELFALALRYPNLQRVRLASVRDKTFTELLIAQVAAHWHLTAEKASVSAAQAGVSNAYENISSMGIDRWLAMLTAFNRCRGNCCVVSCGTAITLDVINEQGVHQGGYIVPGLQLQKKSLLEHTAIRLPQFTHWQASWSSTRPGRSTKEALHHGIFSMTLAWLSTHPAMTASNKSVTIYLTGGDAQVLAPELTKVGIQHVLDPDLVLEGLTYALP